MSRDEHLLTIVAEECNEVAQRATKALRFSLEEKEPGQEHTNKERLFQEFGDLVAVLRMLFPEDFDHIPFTEWQKNKQEKVKRYLEYSEFLGTVND
jgi:hypothetical protein